jgi:hypothetical protein
MYTKKPTFTFCLFILLNVFIFGNDFSIEDINGIWLSKDILNYFCNELDAALNRRKIEFGDDYDKPNRNSSLMWNVYDNQFSISWDDKSKTGFFNTGPERNKIQRIEALGNKITIYYVKLRYGNGYEEADSVEDDIVLEFTSRDLLKVVSSPFNGFFSESRPDRNLLCRIGDYAKKPQATGTINNTGVRFRTRPDLSGDIWFNLSLGEKVEILGISKEKQRIGELEAYWYEARIIYDRDYGCIIDGWVYGAYIDFKNKEELENNLKR